jgi:hypoxanthine-guanine phosphoribosyltransferase
MTQDFWQVSSGSLGIGGHYRHLLIWVDRVDRGHQLHKIFDLCSRNESEIAQHQVKWAVLRKKEQRTIARARP